ncbi:NUDIX hydrolase [Haladaptatus sp. DFWS20]|uniref:NUDIX hydrolase n=1 Tax=Haladaptatus sp. DFWS20 TaxID=3403467 RepID=UPI003EB847DA
MSADNATDSSADSISDGTDEVHKNARKSVVAVDADDNDLEVVNRLEAHMGDGIRHRAFTTLIFDEDDNILLAQRSPTKRLWDTYWDGTVASHPNPGQSQEEATRQRLEDELGITPDQYDDLRQTDKFEYKRYYPREGVEHEVCAVLKLTLQDKSLDPVKEEVGGLMWVPYQRLYENPRWYRQLRLCPWFEIAMRRDFELEE